MRSMHSKRAEANEKKMNFYRTNGEYIYYEILGRGFPVVFLHGNNLDSRYFQKQRWSGRTALFSSDREMSPCRAQRRCEPCHRIRRQTRSKGCGYPCQQRESTLERFKVFFQIFLLCGRGTLSGPGSCPPLLPPQSPCLPSFTRRCRYPGVRLAPCRLPSSRSGRVTRSGEKKPQQGNCGSFPSRKVL